MPGITGVVASSNTLLNNTTYWIDGSERLTLENGTPAAGLRWTFSAVSPAFFHTVGMTLHVGREFAPADVNPPADRVVINRTLATFLFGSTNPIGRRIGLHPGGRMQEIIGVVEDVKQTSPRDTGLGVVYQPLGEHASHVVLAVRTHGDAAPFGRVVRHQLRDLASDLPILSIQTIEEQLRDAIAQERLIGTLSVALGIAAVLIACVGLHALLSYDVAQRTREIGVRVAFGATTRDVAGLVLRDTAALVGLALAAGMPIGVAATRPLTSQLYGIQADDPSTLVAVALVLILAAALATLRPARAALKTDPLVLLRNS